jgi:hypothetical protein
MSYEDFSVERIEEEFEIEVVDMPNLFKDVKPIAPSEILVNLLEQFVPLGTSIGTEKARSEFIIAPILAEVRKIANNKISLFSGNKFEVDKSRGLNGYCDFMFSASTTQSKLSAPVMTIVEAKNDNINSGFGQCMAEMVAAQIYNEHKGRPKKYIHGCVTTGSVWKFMQLTEKRIQLDDREYYLDQLPKILGLFVESVSHYRQ